MGGLDIFKAIGSHQNWTSVENMLTPINSARDDYLIVYTDKNAGYFSSNREGGNGGDDIYSFALIPEKIEQILVATVKTIDKNSNEVKVVENVELTIYSYNQKDYINFEKINNRFITKTDCIDTLMFNASKLGYKASTKNKNMDCNDGLDTVFVDIFIEPMELEVGTTIVLKNIYYDFDKWNIRADATKDLDAVVELMKENPKIVVELGSHTDCRGTQAYNDKLSQRRSDSAVEYIVSKGVNKNRITAKGYGERELLNSCECEWKDDSGCSEEEHQLNRRTEFKVIGYCDEPIYSKQ